jgi:hypothetical protein
MKQNIFTNTFRNILKKTLPIFLVLGLVLLGITGFALSTDYLDASAASTEEILTNAYQKVYINEMKEEVKKIDVKSDQIVVVRIKITNPEQKDFIVKDTIPDNFRPMVDTFTTCKINLSEALVCDTSDSFTRGMDFRQLLSAEGISTKFNGYFQYSIVAPNNLKSDFFLGEKEVPKVLTKKQKKAYCREQFPNKWWKYIKCVRN